MAGSILGQYLCIREFSEVDYTTDLKLIDVPTLIIHGDDDQIVPIGNSAEAGCQNRAERYSSVYEGAGHGLTATHQDRFNADLLAFIRSTHVERVNGREIAAV